MFREGWKAVRGYPRVRWVDVAFAGLVAVGCAFIFWLGKSATFKVDDWVLAGERAPYPLDYLMIPHNDHWSFFMKLVFQALFSVFGLHTYLPYLAAVLLLHGLTVLAIYAAVSAAGGRLFGFAVGSVMLFLGSAHENLFWYAAFGLLGSIAAGSVAVYVLLARPPTRRTTMIVAGLLVLSEMSSGVGLPFVAATGAAAISDPERRRSWWGPVAAGLVYLAWDLVWGRGGTSEMSLQSFLAVGTYMYTGAANAFGAATGLDRAIGYVVVPILICAAIAPMAKGRLPSPAAVLGLVGLLFFLFLTGLVRDTAGSEAPNAPRYITTAATFLALLMAGLMGRPRDRYAAVLRSFVVAPLAVFALAVNGQTLIDAGHRYASEASETRAMIAVMQDHPSAPAVRDSVAFREMTGLSLSTEEFLGLLAREGSPTSDSLRAGVVLPLDAQTMDRGLFRVTGKDLELQTTAAATPGSELALTAGPLAVVQSNSMKVSQVQGCLDLKPLGPDAQVAVDVPSGGSLSLTLDGWGDVGLYLAHDSTTFQEANAIHQTMASDATYRLSPPDMGSGFVWHVDLKLGAGIRSGTLCGPQG